MFLSTEAIVFKVFPFRDTSYILKAFTEDHGLKSYIIRGSQKAKGNMRAKTQALNIVRIAWNEKSVSDLSYASSIEIECPFSSISSNVEKSGIIMFLSEMLYKSLREEMENKELYQFIKNSLLYLDHSTEFSNFHISFLLQLSKYYGFIPSTQAFRKEDFFDMHEGHSLKGRPDHNYYFSEENSRLLQRFSGMNFEECELIKMSREMRNSFLKDMIDYYRYHIEGMEEIKGHEVLQTVFS